MMTKLISVLDLHYANATQPPNPHTPTPPSCDHGKYNFSGRDKLHWSAIQTQEFPL